jgi:hypothetical protein
VILRRCCVYGIGRRGRRSREEEEELRDMARLEAEARAMRATLQRMTIMGTLLASEHQYQQQRNITGSTSRGASAGTTSGFDRQLQHRREFLNNALLTKVSSTIDRQDKSRIMSRVIHREREKQWIRFRYKYQDRRRRADTHAMFLYDFSNSRKSYFGPTQMLTRTTTTMAKRN